MLNVAAVPILTITLRNNLMQVLPIKRWLTQCDNSVSRFLLQVSHRALFTSFRIILGQTQSCERCLVFHRFDSSFRHRMLDEEPTGDCYVYGWYLWHIHSVHHPLHPITLR